MLWQKSFWRDSMKVAISEQMHQIDMDAVTKYGIPEIVLMEN